MTTTQSTLDRTAKAERIIRINFPSRTFTAAELAKRAKGIYPAYPPSTVMAVNRDLRDLVDRGVLERRQIPGAVGRKMEYRIKW